MATSNASASSLLSTEQNQDKRADSLKRVILAGSVGTFVEYFDLAVYGFFATVVASTFFPADDPAVGLLSTFAIFGLAFFARPVGGVICGWLGDKWGRRRTLAWILIAMSVATVAIGLLPGYSAIGIAAPISLLLLRFVQGLSAGGEIAGAGAFVAEHSADGKRATNMSWIQGGTVAAMVAGMALAYFLNTALSDESMASWGWRIPFLISAPLGLIGYYIRTKVSETPQFIAAQEEKQRSFLESSASRDRASSGSHSSPAAYIRLVLLAIGVMAMNSTAFYVLMSYLPTYLIGHVKFPRELALITTGIYATALFCLLPIAGRICDRIGRKKTLLASTISFGVIAYPSFLLITQGTFLFVILGQLILVFPAALGAVMLLPAQMELFTTTVRYRGTAISTGFGAAVFGGSTPFLAEFLATTTGSNMVPALLLVIAASVGFVTALFLKETAHSTLPQ